MSTTQIFHIEIDQEADASFRFHYNNISTGLPTNLTGYRAEMHVRRNYTGSNEAETLLTYTSETGGGLVLGGAAGTVDLYISYEDTATVCWDKALYSIFLINPRGGRIPLVRGFFTVIQSVVKLSNTALPDISASQTTPWPHPNNYDEGGLEKV